MFGGRKAKSFHGGGRRSASFHASFPGSSPGAAAGAGQQRARTPTPSSVRDAGTIGSGSAAAKTDAAAGLTTPTTGDETPEELRETVAVLRRSVIAHADSSAEAMEHFATLQKAHDTLYKEHVHLQEQMDDAVELLKYLKEEKGNYELRIGELRKELDALREAGEGDVVSLTIENLTKERMEWESRAEEAAGREGEAVRRAAALDRDVADLSAKVTNLEKVKEAYDLQTRQQLDAKTKLANLERERGEFLERVRSLEKAAAEAEDASKGREEERARLDATAKQLEEERAAAERLRGENANLRSEQMHMKEELDEAKDELEGLEENAAKYESQEYEMKVLNTKLSNALSHVAQLQREKRESPSVNEAKSAAEGAKQKELERANEALLQEKRDMALYVEKMEETLMEKDELLERRQLEGDDASSEKQELERQLRELREEMEGKEELHRKQVSLIQRQMEEQLESNFERETAKLREELAGTEALHGRARALEEERDALTAEAAGLREELEEMEELHQRQVRSIQQQMEERLGGTLVREKEELAGEVKGLREELEEVEELHKNQVSVVQRQMEEQLEGNFERERDALEGEAARLREELEEREGEHQRQLRQMQDQLEERQRQLEEQQRAADGGGGTGHNELLLENESLKHRVREIKEQLEEQRDTTAQRGEIHERLEREMQERLAKRIAVQLHEQKIAMESQIREELEAEYSSARLPPAGTSVSELEEKLRSQLSQVKEERERWKKEQGEIQKKVLNSQAQFEKVREGFKKKIEKEKARTRDLEKVKQNQQTIIDRLTEEHESVMVQFRELQEQITSQQDSSDRQSQQRWDKEKAKLLEEYHQTQMEQTSQRDEQYATQIHDLQTEINDLLNEQRTHEKEYNAWEEERDELSERYKKKAEELRRAMDDMEQLNKENTECMKKLDDYENQVEEYRSALGLGEGEETSVKYSVLLIELKELKQGRIKQKEQNENLMKQMEQLNTENGDLQQQVQTLEETVSDVSTNLSITQEERNKLQDSLQDTSELCLELESKVSSYKREKEKTAEEYESKIEDLEELLEQTETASLSVIGEKEKAAATMADMETKHREVIAGMQKQVSDTQSQVSKLIDQLAAASNEKASVASDLFATKHEAEGLRETVTQLTTERDSANARVTELMSACESSEKAQSSLTSSRETIDRLEAEKKEAIESLTAERDAANARAAEILSTYESTEKTLSSIKSDADESKGTIDRLAAEKKEAIESLTAERDAANARVSELLSKYESTANALSSVSSGADESQKTIDRLEAEKRDAVESLSAERDAANARITEILSSYESTEKVLSSLKLNVDENKAIIDRLRTEKSDAIAKAQALEETVKELQVKAEDLAHELRVSTSKVNDLKTQIAAANDRLTKAENNTKGSSESSSIRTIDESRDEDETQKFEDYEVEIQDLQSEVDELKESNAQLSTEIDALKSQNASALPQDAEPSVNDKLMKDLVEVNDNVQKLKTELRDLKDKNVVLEEAVLDIQVEKEDLQLENEELASKLTDLTTQAKKMLLNNESLEEAIADQQIEYEDRIAELESQLVEHSDDDDLRKKHEAALETIVKLKKDIDNVGQEKRETHDVEGLKHMEEENAELRQAIEHLSSENDAAKEIKFIVLELRAKNMEMTEKLRVSEEANKAAADIIENLKADNEKLLSNAATQQSDKPAAKMSADDRLVPFEGGADDPPKRDLEAKQKPNKSIDKDTDDTLPTKQEETALVIHERQDPRYNLDDTANAQGALVAIVDATEASSIPPTVLSQPTGDTKEQIQNLTIENGILAQRLGGAVAEKEFAKEMLTKLGAKMEELIERNKFLANMADMKGQHISRGAKYYSEEDSVQNRQVLALEYKGRDPDATGQDEGASAYTETETSNDIPTSVRADEYSSLPKQHDDPSAYSDMTSTILSYQLTKQLEPESASTIANRGGGEYLKHRTSVSREGNDQLVTNRMETLAEEEGSSQSPPKLVKVPGGEYYGQLNKSGQKHGSGKMRYDNGNEYDGQWKNNKRDGKGITKYSSGNVYTGTWKTGKRHGFGVFHIKKTGDVYRGNWAQGLKSGPGVYEYADGELDVSYYEDDVRMGEGVRWSASRDRASRLVDGQLVGEEGGMVVEDATKLTKELGFVV